MHIYVISLLQLTQNTATVWLWITLFKFWIFYTASLLHKYCGTSRRPFSNYNTFSVYFGCAKQLWQIGRSRHPGRDWWMTKNVQPVGFWRGQNLVYDLFYPLWEGVKTTFLMAVVQVILPCVSSDFLIRIHQLNKGDRVGQKRDVHLCLKATCWCSKIYTHKHIKKYTLSDFPKAYIDQTTYSISSYKYNWSLYISALRH